MSNRLIDYTTLTSWDLQMKGILSLFSTTDDFPKEGQGV